MAFMHKVTKPTGDRIYVYWRDEGASSGRRSSATLKADAAEEFFLQKKGAAPRSFEGPVLQVLGQEPHRTCAEAAIPKPGTNIRSIGPSHSNRVGERDVAVPRVCDLIAHAA